MATYSEQPQRDSQGSAAPRSFGEMLRQLPGQYKQVLLHPSPVTFATEMGKATWGSVWFQLIGMALISAILAFVREIYTPHPVTPADLSALSTYTDPQTIQALTHVITLSFVGLAFYATFLAQLVGFFLLMTGLYLSARFLRGQGSFLAQCYTVLLATVPLTIATTIFGTTIYLAVLSVAASIYMLVLQVMAVMAVHRLSGWRVVGAFCLSIVVLVALLTIVLIMFGVSLGVILAVLRSQV